MSERWLYIQMVMRFDSCVNVGEECDRPIRRDPNPRSGDPRPAFPAPQMDAVGKWPSTITFAGGGLTGAMISSASSLDSDHGAAQNVRWIGPTPRGLARDLSSAGDLTTRVPKKINPKFFYIYVIHGGSPFKTPHAPNILVVHYECYALNL